MGKINVAIDGVSGSGKSTVAKLVADRLGYNYIDTGSMYRCVALLVNKYKVNPQDDAKMGELLENHFDYEFKNPNVFLNGEDVTIDIRKDDVNATLPKIVALPKVRTLLVSKQQELAKKGGIIMDGRDIGSVVLKDAKLKIYQVAELETRADRRYKENLEKGINSDYNTILENLRQRDYTDMNVSKALVKCDDAIELDTTNMTIEEVVDCIIKLIKERE